MLMHEVIIEENDETVLIVESDSVDTLEDLTSFTEFLEDKTDLATEVKSIKNSIVIDEDDSNDDFELLCLSSVSSDIGIDTYFKNDKNEENIIDFSTSDVDELESLLSPLEFINTIMNLKSSTQNTLSKLKSLQMKCEKAILDIEHSLEFEEFTVTEGYGQALLIKELRMKRRIIKDTLDRYDSIRPMVDTFEKSFSNKFIKNQLKSLNKIEQVQSSRIYSPRILKNLDISKKPVDTNMITNLEEEVASILNRANTLVKANS